MEIKLLPGLTAARGKRWINLELVPNGILAHRLIEHAAAPYQFPVSLNRE